MVAIGDQRSYRDGVGNLILSPLSHYRARRLLWLYIVANEHVTCQFVLTLESSNCRRTFMRRIIMKSHPLLTNGMEVTVYSYVLKASGLGISQLIFPSLDSLF